MRVCIGEVCLLSFLIYDSNILLLYLHLWWWHCIGVLLYWGGTIRGCYCIWVLERHCFKNGIISGWQLIRVAIYSDGAVSERHWIKKALYRNDAVSSWQSVWMILYRGGTASGRHWIKLALNQVVTVK